MVILIVCPFQAVKPDISGVGIVDILRADGTFLTAAIVDQVQDFFI